METVQTRLIGKISTKGKSALVDCVLCGKPTTICLFDAVVDGEAIGPKEFVARTIDESFRTTFTLGVPPRGRVTHVRLWAQTKNQMTPVAVSGTLEWKEGLPFVFAEIHYQIM